MLILYTDHNVSRRLVGLLRDNGYQVTTALDEGLATARDDQHLLVAAQHGWTLMTHNREDFVLLHGAWHHWSEAWRVMPRPAHAGILVIEQRPERELLQALHDFLASEPSLANELYQWRRSSGWVRWQLSIGWMGAL